MKRILGLDLGTNSIGWALINGDDELKAHSIEAANSRILPMDAKIQGDFESGNSVSQTQDRTRYRGMRRLLERHLLRRERLNRVLEILGFLPDHYLQSLSRYGNVVGDKEVKLAWGTGQDGKPTFLFTSAFSEMLCEFKSEHPEQFSENLKIPYDWTIYYLRKKALTRPVSKQELAWILLNFNKKRGYYQLRGEELDEKSSKREEYMRLKVIAVNNTGERKKGKETWFDIVLENGLIYRRSAAEAPEWVGLEKDFIVTTPLDKNGRPKNGAKPSIRQPKEDDWTLLKKKTEADIENSGKTVGEFIYKALLHDPKQKVRGKLVKVVDRKFYKRELEAIIDKQIQFIPELKDKDLYSKCISALYPSNDSYRNSISKRDFKYLLIDDILFYQRPLKTKKSLISNCPYESHVVIDKETGEIKDYPIKCIAKSNPLFQEFRLWQFISNLRIFEREKIIDGTLKTDVDVTSEFLSGENAYNELFHSLNDIDVITQNLVLKLLKCKKATEKDSPSPYRWNYVEDKKYPGNEVRAEFIKRFRDCGLDKQVLTKRIESSLWHILYSIDDRTELKKALSSFAKKNGWDDSFVESFSKIKPFEKDYGAYSEKAIKRLLPLMRLGEAWSASNIDTATQKRIEQIMAGNIGDSVLEQRIAARLSCMKDLSQFRGLPLWLTCYVVYGKHSEAIDSERWTNPRDIDSYLKAFKQHSLRNPVVEQVVTETLRTVRDIWKQYGKIDEIHIELGRDLKNPADKRKEMSKRINENENTNLRIKALLTEFMIPEFNIENVRPYSPSQQAILKIYESGVLSTQDEVPDEYAEIIKRLSEADIKKRPTRSEILKYKCWLDQKYRSPYTGKTIPLAKLFTKAYEIEHVIPRARYFDDSFSNKVICETAVNKEKGAMLGMEFIQKRHGQIIALGGGKDVEVLSVEEYEKLVQKDYSHNRAKMRKLLMDDIPEAFIERQLNDSRYISRFVTSLLSNIVREEGEHEANSKHLIVTNGSITDRLKKDWGINDVWNRIILPRFKRMNEITGTSMFTAVSTEGHEIPSVPFDLQKGFNKKRIDHRHHAMDAIVIACANRNIVNYLNNESATKGATLKRQDLKKILCTENKECIDKPWASFPEEVYNKLKDIVVSFKQNIRVINKTSNKYQHFEDGKKVIELQTKGDSWAIRKQMHKETYFGLVNLRKIKTVKLKEAIGCPKRIVNKELKTKLLELIGKGYDEKRITKYFKENTDIWSDINIQKIELYYFTNEGKERSYATRKNIIGNFCGKDSGKAEKQMADIKNQIDKITDSGIRKIMLNHLANYADNPNAAFTPEGVEEMNRNIIALNNGHKHQPIYKVRWCEEANKFPVGQKGNKKAKFVEAAKGTNLFFAVYETEEIDKKTGDTKRRRSFRTIPLNEVISRQKQGLSPASEDENGMMPKFVLSPNTLVYVPTPEDVEQGKVSLPLDRDRIYKMVSSADCNCFFIKHEVAKVIWNKREFTSSNKEQNAITGEAIKKICLPLKVDRLGNVELHNNKI